MDHLSHHKAFYLIIIIILDLKKKKKREVCLIFSYKKYRGTDHSKGQELRLKGGMQWER